MSLEDRVFQFKNGEYVLPQKVRFFDERTKIIEVPPAFKQIWGRLWIKNSGERFDKGWRECWVYETRGDQPAKGYPRINRSPKGDAGLPTSLRRFVAGIFFDLDAVQDKRVYVAMKCGNIDCLNPRHMTFADHPNPKLGLE